MDNPLANLIVYWIAIGYPAVSPGACPAHLQAAAGVVVAVVIHPGD